MLYCAVRETARGVQAAAVGRAEEKLPLCATKMKDSACEEKHKAPPTTASSEDRSARGCAAGAGPVCVKLLRISATVLSRLIGYRALAHVRLSSECNTAVCPTRAHVISIPTPRRYPSTMRF